MKIIKDRTVWVSILEDLQNIVPDTTWFCTVEGIADIEADRAAEKAAAKAGSANSNAESSGQSGFAGIFGNSSPAPAPAPETPPEAMEQGGITAPNPEKVINVLKLKGYSLILKPEILGDSLRENLKKSKLFKNAKEDVIIDLVMQEVNPNNIASFIVYLKLNEPIRY